MVLKTLHQRVSIVFRVKETDKTSIHPGSQPDSQTVQTCLQRYESVNESYHLHLKQSYHAGTASSEPFKNLLRSVSPSPSTTAHPHPLPLSFYLPHIPPLRCVCMCDKSGHQWHLYVFESVSGRKDDQTCVDMGKYVISDTEQSRSF